MSHDRSRSHVPGTQTLDGVPTRCSSHDRSFGGGSPSHRRPPLGLRARAHDDARRRDRVAMFNAFYKTFMSVRVRCARAKEDDARIGGRDGDDARVGTA